MGIYSERRYRLDRTFSITSVTIDEAVAILLGWATGPIRARALNDDPTDEELDLLHSFTYSLQEELDSEWERLADGYAEAKSDNSPSEVLAEKLKVLKDFEKVIAVAKSYLGAINAELNEGESSVLKLDTTANNGSCSDKCITLSSLDVWARKNNHLDSILASTSLPVRVPEPQSKKSKESVTDELGQKHEKDMPRLRAQEKAILDEFMNLKIDPKLLPNHKAGESTVKRQIKKALAENALFDGTTVFKKAWDRLRFDGAIANVD